MSVKGSVMMFTEVQLISLSYGFTLGFGLLTGWEAYKQTIRARDPRRSTYVWLIWGEWCACFILGLTGYLIYTHHIPISIGTFVMQITLWAIKIQLLPQIVINRINVIIGDRKKGNRIKWGTAIIVLLINISVYCIWIPGVLNVNPLWTKINYYWDRIEKAIYLVLDSALNYYFIRVVKQRLVNQGSKKYNRLVTFNIRIILVSILLDVLVIASMSLKHSLVYGQFHPLAFMCKLRIELSMANLIRRIATKRNEFRDGSYEITNSRSGIALSGNRTGLRSTAGQARELQNLPSPHADSIMVHKQAIVESEAVVDSRSEASARGITGARRSSGHETDEAPLRDKNGW